MSQREPISISSRWPFERQPEKKEASHEGHGSQDHIRRPDGARVDRRRYACLRASFSRPGKERGLSERRLRHSALDYYQEVRRRVFVAPAYAYDPYFDGPAYYGPSIAYVPPVEYAPPVATYDYGPPVDYGYYGPGPGVAFAGPGVGVAVGY